MLNYIKKIKATNIISNVFNLEINFSNGLNIIAGSNGVGKTMLLKYIQQNRTNQSIIEFDTNNNVQKNIVAFNPKRNASKILIQKAQQIIRQDINARTSTLNQFLNQQIQDDNFQTIKSISEYLELSFVEYRDGENLQPSESSVKTQKEFEDILKQVFDYEIIFKWNQEIRQNEFKIKKDSYELQPNQLSSGENALMSLMFAMFYSKDSTQVYLIDEPEIHLNWQLEEKLFIFLDFFATTYQKQIITTTHSRGCFIKPFLEKTQFLIWKDNQIQLENKPTENIKNILAGDVVKIINGITTEDKIVYVEDSAQKLVLESIKESLKMSMDIQIVEGGCEYVKRLSKSMKNMGINNVYFLIDNDNKTVLQPQEYLNLIQLNKYCIENYFLDNQILEQVDKREDKTKSIQDLLLESIKKQSHQSLAVVKKLIDANKDSVTEEILDKIDASIFIKDFAVSLGYSKKEDFFKAYIEQLNINNNFKEYFSVLYFMFE